VTLLHRQMGIRKLMQYSIRLFLLSAALMAGLACTGRSQTPPPAPPVSAEPTASAEPAGSSAPALPIDTSWLKSDSTAHSVTLSLRVTRPAGGPSALINGYRSGEARVVAPLRWTVKWDWRNDDPTTAHSLVLMNQREKLPLEGGRAAFSNAMSRSVTAGLPAGQTDETTFEAEETGFYWLMCGVPSHALNGEWLELQVSPDAATARLQLKRP
jgi:hypothetical protein